MDPGPGCFLVASPALADPSFLRSVVVLLEHDPGGSLGLIINRPLPMPLRELWAEVPESLAAGLLAAEGGPVERGKGILLHGDPGLAGAQAIGQGLAIGGDLAALARRWPAGGDAHGPRLFLGHSGWGAGQLDLELREGAWLVRAGDPGLVLASPGDPDLWRRLTGGRTGIPLPSVN